MARPLRYMDDKVEMVLSERLSDRRRRLLHETGRECYQAQHVAVRCGITKAAMTKWEYGMARPASFAAWKRWAGALGTRLVIELATGRG